MCVWHAIAIITACAGALTLLMLVPRSSFGKCSDTKLMISSVIVPVLDFNRFSI